MATAEKVDHIIDFAIYLQRSLLRSDQPINDLSLHFKSLPLHHKNLSPSSRIKLNRHGVALWNVCSRSRQTEQFLARKELFAQARFFAYLLLESAAEADFDSLKNALTVGKECLYTGLLELTLKMLEKTAALLEALAASNAYVAEYLLLRLALAWRQDRLDLAEHFFTKLQAEAAQTKAAIAENCVDLFLKVGRGCLENNHSEVATIWLERAAVTFEQNNLLGPETSDLWLNVLYVYTQALLLLEDADAGLLRVQPILNTLQELYGDNIAVSLLQLEIASRGEPIAYSAGIDAFSQCQITESHYNAVIHHVYRLRKLQSGLARRVLERYLLKRLVMHDNDQWVESSLITLVWMTTSPPFTHEIASLEATFTELCQVWNKSLSAEATQGILVFFWKKIEKAFKNEEYGVAAAWCKVAMHQLLSGSMDNVNAGKIQRKLLQCLLKQSKPAEARGAALKMSPNVARHPLSLYLTYCVATRLGDEDLAQDVFKQANSDGVLLACICETLRYQLEDAQTVEQTCTRTCKVFETVATYIHKSSSFLLLEKNWVAMASLCLAQKFYKKWPTHSIIQLLEHAAMLFDVSTVTSAAGEDMRLAEDFERHHATSLFALAILHTKEARISESADARIAKYSDARECAHMCGEHLNSFLVRDGFHIASQRSSSKNVYLQLVVQLTTLLLVKFEASLCIPEKEGAPNAIVARLLELTIEAAELNAPMSTYATFVDMILWAVSGGYQNTGPLISADTAAHILHQLIKAAQGTEQYSVLLTARWIRHLVQLIVSNSKQVTEGDNMSLIVDVVEQALVLAAPRTSPQDDGEGVLVLGAAYPAGELEWLATTLFNLAVDYYLGEKEELGKKWAGKAVELADVLAAIQGANAERGLLARVLRGKMGDLGWSV